MATVTDVTLAFTPVTTFPTNIDVHITANLNFTASDIGQTFLIRADLFAVDGGDDPGGFKENDGPIMHLNVNPLHTLRLGLGAYKSITVTAAGTQAFTASGRMNRKRLNEDADIPGGKKDGIPLPPVLLEDEIKAFVLMGVAAESAIETLKA